MADVLRTRIRPPADLGEAELAEFGRLVGSVAPDHFHAGDTPLVVEYARSILLAGEAAQHLLKEGAVINGKASPWLTVQEKAQRAMTALSARLRLSPQQRMSRHRAGTTSKPGRRSIYDLMAQQDDADDD